MRLAASPQGMGMPLPAAAEDVCVFLWKGLSSVHHAQCNLEEEESAGLEIRLLPAPCCDSC